MRTSAIKRTLLLAGALAGAAVLLVACSAKSPTEPKQVPAPTPGPSSSTWAITVSASPRQLSVSSTTPSLITIAVKNAINGSLPANGSTITVSTDLGTFGSVGGPQSVALQLANGQAQVQLYSSGNEGNATVTAQLNDSVGQTVVFFGTLYITSVSPTAGSPQGGTTVTINGGGFSKPLQVEFGGVTATVLSVTESKIKVLSPPAPNGASDKPVSISVILVGAHSGTATLPAAYTFATGGSTLTPIIISVTPNSGPNAGGTTIGIHGDGFESPVQVIFGSGTCSAFSGVEGTVSSVTQTDLTVTTPPATGFGQGNQNSTVDILVRNKATGNCVVASKSFTYGTLVLVSAITPNLGPATGGNTVVISGQGFASPVDVTIGTGPGIHPTVTSVTSTEIKVTMPAVATCQDVVYTGVTVVDLDTGATNVGAQGDRGSSLTYTVQGVPVVVNSLNPSSGTDAGNTIVTISGSGFGTQNQVLFGTQNATVTKSTSSAVTVKSPIFSGTLQQQSCTASGGAQGTRNAPTSVDVTVTNQGTSCTVTVPGGYTYIPADSTCHATTSASAPVAAFSYAPTGTAHQVQFTDTSSNSPTQWSWNFGDGGTSSLQNPAHTYLAGLQGSTVNVTLTVSNSAGSNSTTTAITVP